MFQLFLFLFLCCNWKMFFSIVNSIVRKKVYLLSLLLIQPRCSLLFVAVLLRLLRRFFCYLQIYREQVCKRASDNKDAINNNSTLIVLYRTGSREFYTFIFFHEEILHTQKSIKRKWFTYFMHIKSIKSIEPTKSDFYSHILCT